MKVKAGVVIGMEDPAWGVSFFPHKTEGLVGYQTLGQKHW